LRSEEGGEEEGSHSWTDVCFWVEEGERRGGGSEEVDGCIEVVSDELTTLFEEARRERRG